MGLDAGWAAASTALSACFYLVDFATTISTLITYHHYEYYCPHAPLPSPLLLRDPICRAIRSSYSIHALPYAFWSCLGLLALAHLTYAFMFWITLDPCQHPVRLAYFMPLIHLYRLVKLLRHAVFRSKRLEELQESQEESSSLYSALGASLEAVPQFFIQFHILMVLGQFLKGSSDPNTQAQTIPINLMISIVASMVSAVYSTSMAIWFLVRKQHVTLAMRACATAGCQTFVVMLGKAMFVTILLKVSEPWSSFALIYSLLGGIVDWCFIGLLLQSHCDSQGRSKFLVVVHSLGFALMATSTGPIYVMVKLGESALHLIWATLLHIFVDLIGLMLVFALPSAFGKWASPCHSWRITSTQELGNKYFTCKVFLGTILPLLFVLLLTSILFAWIHVKSGKNARDRSKLDIVCHIQLSETFEDKTLQQRSMYDLKTLLLLVLMTILFVQKLQTKYVLEGNTHSYKNCLPF